MQEPKLTTNSTIKLQTFIEILCHYLPSLLQCWLRAYNSADIEIFTYRTVFNCLRGPQ